MKIGEFTIKSSPEKALSCACTVGVECDGETIAFRFPQLERDDDNVGPMVYACVNGTTLHVVFCDRDDTQIDLAWSEEENTWKTQVEKEGKQ